MTEVASLRRRWALAAPAFVGWLTHRWLYNLLKSVAHRKTAGTVFYHSVLFVLLLVVYPVALVGVTALVVELTHQPLFWCLLLVLPFTARCYKEYEGLKEQP